MSAKKDLYVVIGLGVTGLSCVRYLVQQGMAVAVTDSRATPPKLAECQQQFPQVPVVVGEFSAELLQQAKYVVVSPGVALTEPALIEAQHHGATIIGDVELFVQAAKAPIVAITGSNGKTTVTTLVGLMLQAAGFSVQVCGNIGTPVLDVLQQPVPDFYVVELSSFQLDTTYSLAAAAAVALNVTADHMDRYPTFNDYLHSKQKIYQRCHAAVVPSDQCEVWQDLTLPSQHYSFGIAATDFCVQQRDGQEYLMHQNRPLLPVARMKLQGKHHVQNALAALALGFSVGADLDKMIEVIAEFSGLPHRCQWVAAQRGVVWYNDSKGTNVGASVAALATLGPTTRGKIILIAGGDAKAADLTPLREPVARYVSHVVLIGKDADLLASALHDVVPLTRATTLPEAVTKASTLAKSGDNVLLSPACASLDMFKNYEHRGQVFVDAVTGLLAHE